MDELERRVMESFADNEDPTIYLERAKQAWKVVTGLEPSYVKLLKLQPSHAHCPQVFVEVDGVRLVAFRAHSTVRGTFQQWDIAETKLGFGYKRLSSPDLSLPGLKPFLARRRKRLARHHRATRPERP